MQQYLAAGLLDELYLHIVPIILGAGERLLENVGDPTLEPVKVIAYGPAGALRRHVLANPQSVISIPHSGEAGTEFLTASRRRWEIGGPATMRRRRW